MQPDPVFEQFLDPGKRAIATAELASRGIAAIPILASLFDGKARNSFGVPYIKLGIPIDCALVVAGKLGSLAKPLEGYLRDAVASGHPYAPQALGAIGSLEEASIMALADQLGCNSIASAEAAYVLVRYGFQNHDSVLKAIQSSENAAKSIGSAIRYLPNIDR